VIDQSSAIFDGRFGGFSQNAPEFLLKGVPTHFGFGF
jgi:hypothetical protein